MAEHAQSKLVLASSSPRRLQLLAQIGIVPDQTLPSDIDETPRADENPRQLAVRLALEKAAACPVADVFVLSADTVVAMGRRLLPKTEDKAEAERCLRLLSGRAHQVITGVAVRAPDGRVAHRAVLTRVQIKRLSKEDISDYLDSGEWHGKAGGYAIQGRAGAFVKALNGSYSAVVGLPLYETRNLLTGLGWS